MKFEIVGGIADPQAIASGPYSLIRVWSRQTCLPAATVIRTHLGGYFCGRGRLSDCGIRFVWKFGLLGPKRVRCMGPPIPMVRPPVNEL
jgi:hypothetical protein